MERSSLLGLALPLNLLCSASDTTFDDGLFLAGQSFHLGYILFRGYVTKDGIGEC